MISLELMKTYSREELVRERVPKDLLSLLDYDSLFRPFFANGRYAGALVLNTALRAGLLVPEQLPRQHVTVTQVSELLSIPEEDILEKLVNGQPLVRRARFGSRYDYGVPVEDIHVALGAVPLHEQIRNLVVAYHQNLDERVYEELRQKTIGLVHWRARYFLRFSRGLAYDDLVAAGEKGLLRAIELYDTTRPFRFSTYAVNWVNQAIRRAISEDAQESEKKLLMGHRLSLARDDFYKKNARQPTHEELQKMTGIPLKKIKEDEQPSWRRPISLDQPVYHDSRGTLSSLLPSVCATPVEVAEHHDALAVVARIFEEEEGRARNAIEKRNVEIIRLRHLEGRTPEEVRQRFHISRQRVHEICSQSPVFHRIILKARRMLGIYSS